MTRALLFLVLAIVALRILRVAFRRRGIADDRGAATSTWDPHAVLGVARGASHDEITHAYRDQLKRYHPDRVADLGPELQQVAHRKTVELQRAYGELTR